MTMFNLMLDVGLMILPKISVLQHICHICDIFCILILIRHICIKI